MKNESVFFSPIYLLARCIKSSQKLQLDENVSWQFGKCVIVAFNSRSRIKSETFENLSPDLFFFYLSERCLISESFHIGSDLSKNGSKTILSIFSLDTQGSDLAHFLEDWSQSKKLSEQLAQIIMKRWYVHSQKIGNSYFKK